MPHVPRWSQEETRAHGEELGDTHIFDNLYFRDVWECAERVSSTPVYEGMFQNRSFGRIACIGDSAFKVSLIYSARVTNLWLTLGRCLLILRMEQIWQ